MKKSLIPTLIKIAVFVTVTVFATSVLLATISQGGKTGRVFTAQFSDVTSLSAGDDVRMAGVRIGSVSDISIVNRREAQVRFTVENGLTLASTVTAAIRYRNLIGQRYVELDQGSGSPELAWPASRTLGLDRTSPALDLTALFDGFQPLFKALDPTQINKLSFEIIQIFQGQGTTVDALLTQTASLTSTLADKDKIIGEVVDNLNGVLAAVNARSAALTQTVSTLQQLVSGLAEDRTAIGSAISGLGGLTTDVTSLLQDGRPALKASIESLGALSTNLAAASPVLQTFLQNLPPKLNAVGRTASYGSWVNLYLCSLSNVPTVPDYTGVPGKLPTSPRCQG